MMEKNKRTKIKSVLASVFGFFNYSSEEQTRVMAMQQKVFDEIQQINREKIKKSSKLNK